MKKQSSKFLVTGIVFLAVAAVFFACGKKGPPMPPERAGFELAAPYELGYEIKENTAIVTWRHDGTGAGSPVTLSGFDIFMARMTDTDCPGCPVIFEKIDTTGPSAREYLLPLLEGGRYYIRIMAVGTRNITSGYSKTLSFEF